MKKVIALALAMAMALSMTSMALTMTAPGAEETPSTVEDTLFPGETYNFKIDSLEGASLSDAELVSLLDSGLVSFSAKATTGTALLDSAKVKEVNDALCLVVETKENYTIEDAKDLVVEVTMTAKKDVYNDNTKWNTTTGVLCWDKGEKLTMKVGFDVANDVEDVEGADKKDDATSIDVADNTIYKMTETGWVEFCGDGNRLSSVKVRLPEDKKVFAYFNEDAIDEIEDKYYDLDAEIEYINFVAKPNLGTKAEIAIQGDYSDKYNLYEYVGGKLEKVDAEWNEDDGLFEFKASKLGAYVISDKALVAEADEAEDEDKADETTESKNPDTGANDVVGVAVALAAVSLVAAGAVSLKK